MPTFPDPAAGDLVNEDDILALCSVLLSIVRNSADNELVRTLLWGDPAEAEADTYLQVQFTDGGVQSRKLGWFESLHDFGIDAGSGPVALATLDDVGGAASSEDFFFAPEYPGATSRLTEAMATVPPVFDSSFDATAFENKLELDNVDSITHTGEVHIRFRVPAGGMPSQISVWHRREGVSGSTLLSVQLFGTDAGNTEVTLTGGAALQSASGSWERATLGVGSGTLTAGETATFKLTLTAVAGEKQAVGPIYSGTGS